MEVKAIINVPVNRKVCEDGTLSYTSMISAECIRNDNTPYLNRAAICNTHVLLTRVRLGRGQPAKKSQPQVMADALLLDTEAAVMSSFAFLPADVEMDDEDYMGEDMDMGNDADMNKHLKMKTKGVIVNDGEFFLHIN